MNKVNTLHNSAGIELAGGDARLNLSLLVIATAQLMFVLDDAIANIALPSIQKDLGVSAGLLPWIVSAFVLAFGGLLLFGGRLGDLYGRKQVLQIGLVVFTIASLLGGLGINVEMLIAARGLQGIGAALAAPNVLALIATNFPVGKDRNRAMAVYGGMSAVGITVGVLLGGVLTGTLGWRWVFFINIPIGLAVLFGTRILVEGQRNTGKLDTLGAVTGTAAVIALTYGITRGEHGWTDTATLGAFGIALVMGALFLWLQSRGDHPILPLNLFSDRNRAGSYATILFIGAGLMGSFYLLALFMQQVMHFGPLATGIASLPFSVGIILSAGISSKLVEQLAPRFVAGPGLLISALGMYWLSTLEMESSYAWHVMPALFITSFGLGMSFVPTTLTAVHNVAEDRAGVASALVNMAQQIGAALGLATFTTISLSASTRVADVGSVVQEASATSDALTYGYTTAFLAGAIMLVTAAVVVILSVNTKRTQAVPAAI
jgi:EmrB/QacA subfamily drug resistance transporter